MFEVDEEATAKLHEEFATIRRERALADIRARLAELEPFVDEDVKRATRLLVAQYSQALRLLADR